MPKESRSRMQKWPSSTLCPPNSTVTGTTHFYPVAIRSAHVICAQALSQSAYRILAASSQTVLQRNEGDLWDTGKVTGDTSIQIAYEGKPLSSGKLVWWKVQVWDNDRNASE